MPQWRKFVTRRFSRFKLDIYIQSLLAGLKEQFGFSLQHMLIHAKGLETTFYFDDEEFREGFGMTLIDHFFAHDQEPWAFLHKIEEQAQQAGRTIGQAELLSGYEQFTRTMADLQLLMWLPAVCEETLFPYAKMRLRRYAKETKAWSIITEPIVPSLLQQEQLDLLLLACNPTAEGLRLHHERYAWLAQYFIDVEPHQIDYFRQRLEAIGEPIPQMQALLMEIEKKKVAFHALMAELQPSDEDCRLFMFVNELCQQRQIRDRARRRFYHLVKPLFDRIKAKIHLPNNRFDDLFHHELLQALEKDKKSISGKPATEYVYLVRNGQTSVIEGNVRRFLEQEGIMTATVQEKVVVKGTVASPGKVQGRARIIRPATGLEDCKKVQQGDILIAVSTKPDYLVAMEQAAAFVTDEGGITSHAAIVSREMRKPCIVNTKEATSVFKDGDLVEVDAEKGTVKKLQAK